MIDVNDVRVRLRGQAIVGEIDEVNGYIRIETRFLYPDGHGVDVFVPQAYGDTSLTLTDLGQTHDWLREVYEWCQEDPSGFPGFESIVDDVSRLHKTRRCGVAIKSEIESLDGLIDGVIRLAQACARVAEVVWRP